MPSWIDAYCVLAHEFSGMPALTQVKTVSATAPDVGDGSRPPALTTDGLISIKASDVVGDDIRFDRIKGEQCND